MQHCVSVGIHHHQAAAVPDKVGHLSYGIEETAFKRFNLFRTSHERTCKVLGKMNVAVEPRQFSVEPVAPAKHGKMPVRIDGKRRRIVIAPWLPKDFGHGPVDADDRAIWWRGIGICADHPQQDINRTPCKSRMPFGGLEDLSIPRPDTCHDHVIPVRRDEPGIVCQRDGHRDRIHCKSLRGHALCTHICPGHIKQLDVKARIWWKGNAFAIGNGHIDSFRFSLRVTTERDKRSDKGKDTDEVRHV